MEKRPKPNTEERRGFLKDSLAGLAGLTFATGFLSSMSPGGRREDSDISSSEQSTKKLELSPNSSLADAQKFLQQEAKEGRNYVTAFVQPVNSKGYFVIFDQGTASFSKIKDFLLSTPQRLKNISEVTFFGREALSREKGGEVSGEDKTFTPADLPDFDILMGENVRTFGGEFISLIYQATKFSEKGIKVKGRIVGKDKIIEYAPDISAGPWSRLTVLFAEADKTYEKLLNFDINKQDQSMAREFATLKPLYGTSTLLPYLVKHIYLSLDKLNDIYKSKSTPGEAERYFNQSLYDTYSEAVQNIYSSYYDFLDEYNKIRFASFDHEFKTYGQNDERLITSEELKSLVDDLGLNIRIVKE